MNVCGLRHFASVWKEILVSLRGLPRSPCFHKCMGGIFCAQNTQSNTIAHTHTHGTHRARGVHEEMRGFHLQSENQTGSGSGTARLFS